MQSVLKSINENSLMCMHDTCQNILSQEITQPGNMDRKIQFLLIYENMLKSIAMTFRECKAHQENKASYNTVYIALDLIGFFGDD